MPTENHGGPGSESPEKPDRTQRALDELMKFMEAEEQQRERIPVLELGFYRKLLRGIAPPTDEQIEAFAHFTSTAKSWYKHLPLLPPGAPLHFYIDPWAGLDRIIQPEGETRYLRRTESSEEFHYTSMPTESYRLSFGRLQFACGHASGLVVGIEVELEGGGILAGFLDNNHTHPEIGIEGSGKFRIPDEILEAGTTEVTGMIHPTANKPWLWRRPIVREDPFADLLLDETSAALLRRIRECIDAHLHRGGSGPPNQNERWYEDLHADLSAILEPVRDRMLSDMVAAMTRMRRAAYG